MKKFLVVLGVLMGGLLVSCPLPSNEPYGSLSDTPNAGVTRAIQTAEEYTLFYSGDTQGTVVIQREEGGKITITPNFKGDYFAEGIDYELCPLIPSPTKVCVYSTNDIITDSIVIDGNTTTITNSDGSWKKIVVDGNTTTVTNSDSNWYKSVFDGNITTGTSSDGKWDKTVVYGNTTEITDSDGKWYKSVVDGNTTTFSFEFDDWIMESVEVTVVDKQGHNVFIRNNSSYKYEELKK
jgi:hypothetical protein